MHKWIAIPAITVAIGALAACGTSQPASTESAPAAKSDAPAAAAPAAAAKGEHVFRGKIEQVNDAEKTLTVNGEDVPGWMSAMTMVYKPDKPEILATIKVGDQITAKVVDGDFSTLHDVQIVKPEPK